MVRGMCVAYVEDDLARQHGDVGREERVVPDRAIRGHSNREGEVRHQAQVVHAFCLQTKVRSGGSSEDSLDPKSFDQTNLIST